VLKALAGGPHDLVLRDPELPRHLGRGAVVDEDEVDHRAQVREQGGRVAAQALGLAQPPKLRGGPRAGVHDDPAGVERGRPGAVDRVVALDVVLGRLVQLLVDGAQLEPMIEHPAPALARHDRPLVLPGTLPGLALDPRHHGRDRVEAGGGERRLALPPGAAVARVLFSPKAHDRGTATGNRETSLAGMYPIPYTG
jgi:hypothetical protein